MDRDSIKGGHDGIGRGLPQRGGNHVAGNGEGGGDGHHPAHPQRGGDDLPAGTEVLAAMYGGLQQVGLSLSDRRPHCCSISQIPKTAASIRMHYVQSLLLLLRRPSIVKNLLRKPHGIGI